MGPSPDGVVALLAVAFISVSLSGCSNSGSSGLSPSFNGKWTVMLEPGNTFPPHPEVDMNLTQTGGTLSSDANNTVDNLDCVAPQDPPNDSTSGSINGEQFMLAISIGNGTPNAQGVRLTGTVAKNHGAVTGSYESDPGPCFGGKTGMFIATFIAPVSDPFAGTMINNSNGATSNVTALLIEDANFNVSASLTVMSNTCFSSLASSPAHPGFSIGRLTDFEVSDAAIPTCLTSRGRSTPSPLHLPASGTSRRVAPIRMEPSPCSRCHLP